MKKFTLFLALFSTITFYAQHRRVATKVRELTKAHTAFTTVNPFSVQGNASNTKITDMVSNATLARLDKAVAKQITQAAPQFIELAIPYNGTTITVQLYKAEIFAQGFHADTDKQKGFSYSPGAYYRGIIKGDEASLASFSFFNDEIKGTVSSAQFNNLVVAHLPQERDRSSYVIYSDANLAVGNNFNCATSGINPLEPSTRKIVAAPAEVATDRCATIYFEIDNDIYIQNNSSQQATGNWLTALFNNVQTLYDNDGITVSLKSFMVWTADDPYFGAESYDYLSQFFSRYNNQDFDGDVGQLLGSDPGSLGGLAALSGLCTENSNISYVDIEDLNVPSLPLYSWEVQSVAHELGHLFGSEHTHDCAWNGNGTPIDGCGTMAGFPGDGDCDIAPVPQEGGTIMSYCHVMPVGVNLALGFGPQPAERIHNFISSASCTGTSCAAQACHSNITGLAATSIAEGTGVVSWDDETTGPWLVSYHTTGTDGEWQQVTDRAMTFTGLLPNTYYIVEVKPVCDEGVPAISQIIILSDADWCSGQVFTDTGGVNGGYGINQHITKAFIPLVAGNKIKVDFTSFGLEDGFDFIRVYDGSDTLAPLIGEFTGFTLPGSFISTAEDGSLTVEFISDEVATASGWIANVSCQAVLGRNENAFTNFSYYPNPATNRVTITAKEPLTELKIFNAAGQLLLSRQVDGTNVVIDISPYAAGVYFFKVSGGDKSANFNIIKY
ncbi:M12 family metallo-peptidase [Flavobacterium sp. RHBU_24]|uniref:M12 family metallo-peptidase n=1 Tax=Flavobacterium sp. RHBU_24 TaxID=3391185 RepID=UPI003984E70B